MACALGRGVDDALVVAQRDIRRHDVDRQASLPAESR